SVAAFLPQSYCHAFGHLPALRSHPDALLRERLMEGRQIDVFVSFPVVRRIGTDIDEDERIGTRRLQPSLCWVGIVLEGLEVLDLGGEILMAMLLDEGP